MQNNNTTNRIKIVLALMFTFFGVKLLTPSLFLADSPKINPMFIGNTQRFIAGLGKNKIDQNTVAKVEQPTPPPNVVFKYVSKGVSAAEDQSTGQKYIKVEAGTKYKIVGEITINGVKYPKIEFIK